MKKETVTSGKLFKSYILNYLLWLVVSFIGIEIIYEIFLLFTTFEYTKIYEIADTIILIIIFLIANIISMVITIHKVFKKKNIKKKEIPSFMKMVNISFIIFFALNIIYFAIYQNFTIYSVIAIATTLIFYVIFYIYTRKSINK